MGRSFLYTGCALIACAALAGCSPAPQPPAVALGPYQPASLTEAVIFGNRTAVENYLAVGVDPNEPEPDGTTPLMRAVHGQMPELAELLIAAGADVKKANFYGVTPLYIAARAGDLAATRLLLAAGADANAALPSSGETVLMTAADTGNPEVVRELLTGGEPGLELAELGEMRAAARVAEAAGYATPTNPAVGLNYAEVNARDRWYGRTALMVAAAQGHTEAVRLLIEAGSDISLTDEEGATALSLARSYGHVDVATLLEGAGAA